MGKSRGLFLELSARESPGQNKRKVDASQKEVHDKRMSENNSQIYMRGVRFDGSEKAIQIELSQQKSGVKVILRILPLYLRSTKPYIPCLSALCFLGLPPEGKRPVFGWKP